MLPYHHYRSYPSAQKQHHQRSPDLLSWNTGPSNNVMGSPNFNFVPAPKVEDNNVKLIDSARKGFSQFRKDFLEDEEVGEERGVFGALECPREVVCGQLVQKEEKVGASSKLPAKFGVDDEVFEDRRHVVDFVSKLGGGMQQESREFRLFEVDDRMTEVMKCVYNVNNMEMMVPWEICSKRMYPRSVERWPIDVVGLNDFKELRGKMLMFGGHGSCGGKRRRRVGSDGEVSGSSSSSGSTEERSGSAGEDVVYGLRSLARILSGECVEGNPMGFLTFAGMNLNKLMKHLDKKEPITPTFAGPFAEHNFCLDYCGLGVTGAYDEYDFTNVQGQEDGFDSYLKWRNTIRIKRSSLALFSFEILAFIFYTFYGDALQLLAANELYRRGWRYHKLFQVWISPWNGQAGVQLRGYEPRRETCVTENLMVRWPSGVYVYFHYGRWEFWTREFKVNDGVLEGRPDLFEEGLWE